MKIAGKMHCYNILGTVYGIHVCHNKNEDSGEDALLQHIRYSIRDTCMSQLIRMKIAGKMHCSNILGINY